MDKPNRCSDWKFGIIESEDSIPHKKFNVSEKTFMSSFAEINLEGTHIPLSEEEIHVPSSEDGIHVPSPDEIFLRAGKIIEEAEEKEIQVKVQSSIDVITEDLAQRLAYWQKNKIKSSNSFEDVSCSFESKNIPEVYGIIELESQIPVSLSGDKYPRVISLLITSLEQHYDVNLSLYSEEEYTSGISIKNNRLKSDKSLYKSLIITLKNDAPSQKKQENPTLPQRKTIPRFSVIFDTKDAEEQLHRKKKFI